MKNRTRVFVPLFALFAAILLSGSSVVQAQSVSVGADVVNRYVWRGADFGNAAAIQPDLSFSQGGFTIGSWGSYSLSPGASGSNEHDLYASYSFETNGSGTFSIGVTDYYFPSGDNPLTSATEESPDFFNYDSDGDGAHTIEPNLGYSGPDSFPISVYAAINAYNDPDNAVWLEASYPFSVQDVDLSVAIGGTPSDDGGFYTGDDQAGITKASLSASKSIEITDGFSLPIMASYYLNPYNEASYFVFGLSL